MPDDTPSQCDPDGENPCCSHVSEGNCGNTTKHCTCEHCTDYSNIYKDWRETRGKEKWRSDKKCGFHNPLPDGTPAQCDPDGENPCCNDDKQGKCGNTTDHCTCELCTNFKILYKDWRDSDEMHKWRYDKKCGSYNPLPDGTPAQCDPNGENPCCDNDENGNCGNTDGYCSCEECTDYRIVYRDWKESGGTQKWRSDKKCGSKIPLPDGKSAECDPDGDSPCCDDDWYGTCGNGIDHCNCDICKDYKFLKDWEESRGNLKWRYDGRCGSEFPLPDGSPSECDPDGENPCCSHESYGNCRDEPTHCSCNYCTDYKFLQDFNKSGGTMRWLRHGNCGSSYLLPDKTPATCDPDGENPCCNEINLGNCGNTTDRCNCDECTDYKIVNQEWEDSGGKRKWRYDQKCGSYNPLPDGSPAQCDPDGENPCCDAKKNGKCIQNDHCTCNECTDYELIKTIKESGGTIKWRHDGRCGSEHPLPDGTASQCDPDGDNPCCDGLDGECRNSTDHCDCEECTDYKIIDQEWRESQGKQKWRYDKKCGLGNTLPDGTAAECDPNGSFRCCNDVGECVNTTNHCSCYNCTDYKIIYRDWEKSQGQQRWRYDGKCGAKFPLSDGTPAECDPAGEKPCCGKYSDCSSNDFNNACLSNVDFRAVQEIRDSGDNCSFASLDTGFLKIVCYNESSFKQYYKCAHSDVYYEFSEIVPENPESVTEICKNDTHAYQMCGLNTNYQILGTEHSDVLCGGYFCEQKTAFDRRWEHRHVDCPRNDCDK